MHKENVRALIEEIFPGRPIPEGGEKCFVKLLEKLSEQEEAILRLTYGLDDCEKHPLDQLATWFGLTEGQISNIIRKSFLKLRHPARSKKVFLE